MKLKGLIITCFVVFVSCKKEVPGNPLTNILNSESIKIRRVMDSIANYELQIRYTQIHRNGSSISFKDFDFQVNDQNYFYPASTVKFAASVAALEKLNELDSLNLETRFYVEGDSIETTFKEAIQAIFAVSDNIANNQLVEFLGQDDINYRFRQKNLEPIRISHRLSTTDADDPTTKALVIYLNDSTTTTSTTLINKYPEPLDLEGIQKGNGFFSDDSLYREPFDFSLKNYFPIATQNELLKRIIFPEAFSKDEQFSFSKEQHQFLRNAMHQLPKEVGYNPAEYYDSYGKFFMYGDSKAVIPESIEIYNKVGYAYGTLTDNAYILDKENNIEFILTATILVNKNGIFNDDTYEYESIGIPFLAELGRQVYQYELARN